MPKIFDCITFYNENLLTNSRFEILDGVVDYFIICESKYDHKGVSKKLNFKLLNNKFSKKIRYLVIDHNFPTPQDRWSSEEYQREYIFNGLKDANDNDLIMYSDSDEIPNPESLEALDLKKKYGVFLQNFFVYKINIFNPFESPWQGTRITKKKNLKKFNFLRKKIKTKNLEKPFWKFGYEKSIQIIKDGGWHFNNLYNLETLSEKIKSFPHEEFNSDQYSSKEIIEKKINKLEDLFERGHNYKKISIDKTYPKFILQNLDLYKDFILK